MNSHELQQIIETLKIGRQNSLEDLLGDWCSDSERMVASQEHILLTQAIALIEQFQHLQ